jgi:hypothetical protein
MDFPIYAFKSLNRKKDKSISYQVKPDSEFYENPNSKKLDL